MGMLAEDSSPKAGSFQHTYYFIVRSTKTTSSNGSQAVLNLAS